MKRIYIDMDGVMCDFTGAFRKEQNRTNTFPQSRVGFFLGLDPILGAIESINKLRQDPSFKVYVLTRPSIKNLTCFSEKAGWIKKYFGEPMLESLILCCDKSLVKGDYLIDDDTIHGQLEFEGELIQFGSEKFPDWDKVMKYLYTTKA